MMSKKKKSCFIAGKVTCMICDTVPFFNYIHVLSFFLNCSIIKVLAHIINKYKFKKNVFFYICFVFSDNKKALLYIVSEPGENHCFKVN